MDITFVKEIVRKTWNRINLKDKDPKYRPSKLLQHYVDSNWLGVKTGKGFYEYPKK